MVGNSPTLILIKAHTNLIFGGFTSVPWECHEEEVDLPDESAFLFSVSKNTKHIPYQIFEDAVHHESLEFHNCSTVLNNKVKKILGDS